MEILGIGPLEFVFILIIALIILGPGDMAKAGKTLGRFMRKLVTSEEWRTVQKATREIRTLPNKLMRDAALEEMKELTELNKIGGALKGDIKKVSDDLSAWTSPALPTPPATPPLPVSQPEPQPASKDPDPPISSDPA